jgi:hypothetical protein
MLTNGTLTVTTPTGSAFTYVPAIEELGGGSRGSARLATTFGAATSSLAAAPLEQERGSGRRSRQLNPPLRPRWRTRDSRDGRSPLFFVTAAEARAAKRAPRVGADDAEKRGGSGSVVSAIPSAAIGGDIWLCNRVDSNYSMFFLEGFHGGSRVLYL